MRNRATCLVYSAVEFPRMELVLHPFRDGYNYAWEYGDGESPCGGWFKGSAEEVRAAATGVMRMVREAGRKLLS